MMETGNVLFSILFICTITVMLPGCNGYYIVYLEGYPGNLKLIELTDVTADTPAMLNLNNAIDITPNSLRNVCGNPDVSPDGKHIVFGAITPSPESWDIYIGDLNIAQGTIDNLQKLISTDLREEDPRYSYDGNSFVYKAGKSWVNPIVYDILIYNISNQQTSTVVQCSCNNICSSNCNHCELWGPAYHPCGNKISYTARICGNSVNYDEIYVYDFDTDQAIQITNNSYPDMYSHWKRDGTLLFSRKYGGVDNIYLYDPNNTSMNVYLSETGSDDDAYAFKQDNNLFLFIGLADGVEGYELYLVKNEIAFQLTNQSNMLGPVVFDLNIAVTIPSYCMDQGITSNPTTTDLITSTTTATRTTSMGTDMTASTKRNTDSTMVGSNISNQIRYSMLYFMYTLCFCVYYYV